MSPSPAESRHANAETILGYFVTPVLVAASKTTSPVRKIESLHQLNGCMSLSLKDLSFTLLVLPVRVPVVREVLRALSGPGVPA